MLSDFLGDVFFWLLGFLVAVVCLFDCLVFFPVVSCLFDCFVFTEKFEMIFVVVYNLENRNPPETENKSARNRKCAHKAGRALVQAGHKSKQFKVVFSQKKTKLWIMFWRSAIIDGFWIFADFFVFAPKSPSFFCFFLK